MKEHVTMRKLIQEGWIPVLTAALSAAAILSLEYSTGMVYLTGFLLMGLYFAAIAANRVNVRAVVVESAKRLLRQSLLMIRENRRAEKLDMLTGHILRLREGPGYSAKQPLAESLAALRGGLSGLIERVHDVRSCALGIDTGDMSVSFRKSKIALGKLLQSFKSLA